MFFPRFDNLDPKFQDGVEHGMEIAESYLKQIAKDHYKAMKHGLLRALATTNTISSHKCNCEFCGLDPKNPRL